MTLSNADAARGESKKTTHSRRWLLLSLLGVAVVCMVIGAQGCFTKTEKWNEAVHLIDGRTLQVHHVNKEYQYFGVPHGGGIGGGEISHSISFQSDGTDYRFESLYIPIVLHPLGKDYYLVVFDRETDFTKCRFRFYLLNPQGSQEEILGERFPKQLAIQNMWLDKDNGFTYWPNGAKRVIDEYQIVQDMDPADYLFRESFTAKLWERLETGQEYYVTHGRDQSEEFIRSYKEKYIAGPAATQATSQGAQFPDR